MEKGSPTASPQTRRRERSPWLGPLIAAIILGSVVILLLAVVPLPQHEPESFSISSVGGFKCGWGPNLTVAHDGTFVFSWVTNDSTEVSFVIILPSGVTMFASNYQSGEGSIDVIGGSHYAFNLCSGGPVTLQVTGTLNFAIPLL